MYLILLRYELDDLLRANAYARAASHAVFSVDSCNTVYNADCVELANVSTVAESDASEHAGIRGSEPSLCALAGLHALPIKDCAGSFACTVAHYLCYLRLCRACRSSEDLGDLCRNSSSARGTLCARQCFVSNEVCRIVVAACESAAAAVSARQHLSDLSYSLVYCYMEYLGCEYQKAGTDETDDCY